MSGNVIQFPRSEQSTIHSDSQVRKAEIEKQRYELVLSVRKAAEDPKRKFERDHEIWPAQMFDRLIAEAKVAKITQRDIAEALSKKHGKVHLERLRADHRLSPDEAKKAKGAENIVKKIQPYVQALDTVADLLRKSPDDVIWDAFRETEFGPAAVKSPDDPAVELNFFLHRMAQAVIRTETLTDYFNKVRNTPHLYDPVSKDFLRGNDSPLAFFLSHRGYEGKTDASWSQHAFPSVSLLRVHRATFSGPIVVEREPVAPARTKESEAARIVSPIRYASSNERPRPLGPSDKVKAEVAVFSDIRLVIAPKESTDFGPLLELRSFVQLNTQGKNRPLTFPFSVLPLGKPNDEYCEFDEFVGSVAARFEDGWHRVTGFGGNEWNGLAELAPSFGTSFDNGLWFDLLIGNGGGHEFAVYWEPLNYSTVKQLMQLFERRMGKTLFNTDGPHPKPSEIRFLGCKNLETALHTGAIEEALRADCQHLKAALEKRIEQYRAICAREADALIQRWQAMDPQA